MVLYATDLRTLVMQELLHAASSTLISLSAAGALAAACALGHSGARQLLKALRRQLQLQHRRSIARGLIALRHDRDYLLGCLPPSVSVQVLQQLDRASLAALRATCRQCYLLVGAAASSLVLDAHALRVAASLPLEAVWPQLKAISLHLNPLQEEPELFARADHSSSTSQAVGSHPEARPASDSSPTPASAYIIPGKGTSWDPGMTSRVADAVLRSMLEQCGLDGLQKLQFLDMSRCSAGFSLDTWSCLARCLPCNGVTLLTPLRCLLGPTATAYTPRHTSTHPELLACLRQLAHHAQKPQGLTLHLTGGAFMVQVQQQLHDLVNASGPHLLSALKLVDLYPWTGSLDWTPLTHLSHLTHLSVTPRTPLSMRNLLHVLKRIHTLQHLSLLCGDDWNLSTPVGHAELVQLQHLTQIVTLEVPVIKLSKAHDNSNQHPAAAAGAPNSNNTQGQNSSTPALHSLPVLAHLRSLSFLQLQCTDRLEPQHLAVVVPNLTFLAAGTCPQAHHAACHGLTASEEEAAMAAATAAAHQPKPSSPQAGPAFPPLQPVALNGLFNGPAGLGGQHGAQHAAQQQEPQQWLTLLQGLTQLEEVHVGTTVSAALAAELASVLHARQLETALHAGTAIPAINMLPSIRALLLHHVVGYAHLFCLLSLLEHAHNVLHVGLHHVSAANPNGPTIQLAGNVEMDFKWVGPYELVEKLVCAHSLQHLELEAGDFALVHQLCTMAPPVRCLTLSRQHMLLDGDVHDLVAAMRASTHWSWLVPPLEPSHAHDTNAEVINPTPSSSPPTAITSQQGNANGISSGSEGSSSSISSKQVIAGAHLKLHGARQAQRMLRLLGCKQLKGYQLEAALNGPDLLVQCTDWRVLDMFLHDDIGAESA